MTADTNTTHPEPGPAADPGRSTPGEYLRKLREEKGLTHAAVGSALHLTVHYVKALEADEFGKLPGLTFVKGYLRAYARFLGADVESVLARFDAHIAGLLDAGMHTARVERSKRRQDQALRWGIGAGVVVVAALVGGWWFMSDRSAPEQAAGMPPELATAEPEAGAAAARAAPPSAANPAPVIRMPAFAAGAAPQQATAQGAINGAIPQGTVTPMGQSLSIRETQPVATGIAATTAGVTAATNLGAEASQAATAPPSPAPDGTRQVSLINAGNDELHVSFNGSSWIEVDDGSRVRLYQDMLSAGDTLTIRGTAPFHVLLGDAANVEVSLNAAAVDISDDIRADSTARVVVGAPAAATVPAAEEAPL